PKTAYEIETLLEFRRVLVRSLIPYLIIRVCGTSLNLPAFRMGIIMKRKTIHKSMLERLAVAEASRHNSFCPLIVIYVWTAGDLEIGRASCRERRSIRGGVAVL